MLSLMVLKLFKTDKVQARSFRSMSCLAIRNNQICYYQFDDIDNT